MKGKIEQFRKKPVVIEAMQLSNLNYMQVKEWINGSNITANPAYLVSGEKFGIGIHTLEGEMRAELGDWIIKGVKGEFYPCKPDIFQQTYEELESNESCQAGINREKNEQETAQQIDSLYTTPENEIDAKAQLSHCKPLIEAQTRKEIGEWLQRKYDSDWMVWHLQRFINQLKSGKPIEE